MDPIVAMIGANPFFAFKKESDEPTPNELSLLEAYIPGYISTRYTSGEIRERFWGVGINTVILLKRRGLWFYRRATWQEGPTWMPENGAALEDLLETL